MKAEQKRFYEIDLLRFVAALSVLIFHYMVRGHLGGKMVSVNFVEFSGVLKYGYLGVELFFVISGYVILLSAWGKSPLDFAISRVVRLYPAFWVCVTISYITTLLIGTTPHFSVPLPQYLANMTMVPQLFRFGLVDGVYWTLLVELRFYLLIFLMLVFKQQDKIKVLLFLWLLISYAIFFYPLKGINALLITDWSPYFIIGASFFLLKQEKPSALVIITLLGAIILSLSVAIAEIDDITTGLKGQIDFNPILISLILLGMYIGFYFIVNRTHPICSKSFYYLGAVTYPLYLLHAHIGYMLFNYLGNTIDRWVLLVGITTAIMGLSYLVHIHIELRYAKQFKQFLYRYSHFFIGFKTGKK